MSEERSSQRQMNHDDVDVRKREAVFEGFFKVERLALRHRRFRGDWSEIFQRELFIRPDATCVLPYDPVRDEVVLIEQFRAGALGRQQVPWLLELVAGIHDKDEDPEAVARREAEEEAGLNVTDMEPILSYLVSPGGSDELVHLYCGRVDSAGAGGIHGLDEENEDILVHVYPALEAIAMIGSTAVNNAAALIALQWFSTHRERIRNKWLKS